LFPQLEISEKTGSKELQRNLIFSPEGLRPLKCFFFSAMDRRFIAVREADDHPEDYLKLTSSAIIADQYSGLHHELANLVTILHGYQRQIQMFLEQESVPLDKITKASTKISDVANRMSGLALRMKNLSRKEASGPSSVVELNEVISEALELISYKFAKNSIKYALESEVKSARIEGSSSQLSLLFLALMGWCVRSAQEELNNSFALTLTEKADQVVVSLTLVSVADPSEPEKTLNGKDFEEDISWELDFSYLVVRAHHGILKKEHRKDTHKIERRFLISFPKINLSIEPGGEG
jgi:hypothetical protein